jgi:hypothetical protein
VELSFRHSGARQRVRPEVAGPTTSSARARYPVDAISALAP